jgi:hypothetical protein
VPIMRWQCLLMLLLLPLLLCSPCLTLSARRAGWYTHNACNMLVAIVPSLSCPLQRADRHTLMLQLRCMPAVYEAGRIGAAKQEQWWQSGGSNEAGLLAPSRGFGSASAGKRKRFTAAETNKENQGSGWHARAQAAGSATTAKRHRLLRPH